ncbi:MFS transporter [Demequina salsinemoris]|uniref:MFS transporter n=1 Tax=Demequina salsinemoris TaxID=577470 RepID=UPI000A04A2D5|nr:MFS transporter [Demequina salsinemoris]
MSAESTSKIPGKVWYRSGVAGMASYLDAAAIISTGTALVLYMDPMGITEGQVGQLSAILTFLMALGALVGGRLADMYGRKRVFLATMSLYVVGAGIMALAPSVTILYLGVALLGFAVGADLPASLAMIAEEAPPEHRGKLISFSHILWLVGILASQLLAMVIGGMGQAGGQILYLHLVIVAAAVLILRASLPESHRWAAQHEAAAAAPSAELGLGGLKQLVKGPYLWPMVTVALFYALVNIGANTGGQFTTYMYVTLAGSTVSFASLISFVTFGIAFVATYFLMRIVDGSNRMRWFKIMAVAYAVGSLVPAIFGVQVWSLVLMGIFSSIAGAVAGEPMFKVWAQELISTTYRSTAQGFMIFFTRVVAALVALWTPTILAVSPSVLFIFVAVCIAVGGLLGVFVIDKFPRVADEEDSIDALEGAVSESAPVNEAL